MKYKIVHGDLKKNVNNIYRRAIIKMNLNLTDYPDPNIYSWLRGRDKSFNALRSMSNFFYLDIDLEQELNNKMRNYLNDNLKYKDITELAVLLGIGYKQASLFNDGFNLSLTQLNRIYTKYNIKWKLKDIYEN